MYLYEMCLDLFVDIAVFKFYLTNIINITLKNTIRVHLQNII